MSKVICDVCGTTFPETANQCPICGSAKNAGSQTATEGGNTQAESGSTYSYVSGGRFSKGNVRKRNKTGQPMQRRDREPAKKDKESESSNKGLVIVVIVLLLAIIAVFAYLAITWFGPDKDSDEGKKDPIVQTTTQNQIPENNETEGQNQPSGVACTDLVGLPLLVELDNDKDASKLLAVSKVPVNTTDKVTYKSLDTTVATVTDGGLVTFVAPGETTIIVTCGEIQKECSVVCRAVNNNTETDPTTPTEPDPGPGPSTDVFVMELNTKYFTSEGVGDVKLTKIGATWRMFKNINVEASKVVWTSEDEAYVTIKDGDVTAVASTESLKTKYVLVHAEYGGVKYSCRVRVELADPSETPTTPPATDPTTPTTPPATSTVQLMNRVDFTLQKVGDIWNVYKNTEISATVAATDITWVSEDPNVVTVVDGVVTAVGKGHTYIHAEYNGQTATCKVIVK